MNSLCYLECGIDTKLATKYNGWLHFSSGINLHSTLLGGQSFRWRPVDDGFIGVMYEIMWFVAIDSHKTTPTRMFYRVLAGTTQAIEKGNFREIIERYFSMGVDAKQLASEWMPILGDLLHQNPSLSSTRLLTQEPFETVISFICSANNNISRITNMVNSFSRFYGEKMTAIKEQTQDFEAVSNILMLNEDLMYAFPEIETAITKINEQKLVEAKYGYRAKYIVKTLQIYKSAFPFPDEYEQLLVELQKLSGVGPKVADCIALMGFGKTEAVPLDTHMLQITKKLFSEALPVSICNNAKTLTQKMYKELSRWYRETFGVMAGWAQLWLFIADLQHSASDPKKKISVQKTSQLKKSQYENEMLETTGKIQNTIVGKKKILKTKVESGGTRELRKLKKITKSTLKKSSKVESQRTLRPRVTHTHSSK